MASSPFLLQLILCMICVHLSVAIDDPVPYNIVNCSETSRSSTPAFQSNLNSTLQYLISTSSTGKGFDRASSGTGVDTANGIFLCRGDSSGDECHACVNNSSTNILSRCPNHKEAIIWSNHCMLRFSNRSIFNKLEEQPTGFVSNRSDATDPNRFYTTLGALMGQLIYKAVSSPAASKFYAVDEDAIPESNNRLYGLVQCTPDITGDDCRTCLRNSLGLVRENGLIVLKPSCRFRFEVFPFYDTPSSLAWTPDAGGGGDNKKMKRLKMIIIAICIPTAVILALTLIIRRSVIIKRKCDFANQERDRDEISSSTGESVQFDFGTIEAATNKFSVANKIGEGGFGPVYQGTLPYGQKIAIKRLSEGSNQGGQEFKNEVEVVAKLQHRNLVRLLGFCLHEKEKILVYEYVPNKSLDYFLFDAEEQQQLDWETRTKIIQGIARGLLYLHEDSRLRIIHRDLKASNVLLDESMNPKISDFGTARILKVDQIQESTNRIVGTYGYMSPEYALDGNFSVKSDVFSFGVLMLEIISGKKNKNVSALLRHAWRQWREELVSELVDPGLRGSCPQNEVTRCVHIALLCVEEDPTDRPTMATAVTMLNTFSFPLPTPKRPTCFAYSTGSESYMPKIVSESDESTNNLTSCTVPR